MKAGPLGAGAPTWHQTAFKVMEPALVKLKFLTTSLCRVLVFLFCTWPPSPPLPPPPSHNSFTHSHTHTRTHTHTTLSYSLTYNIVTQHCLTPKLSHNFVTHTQLCYMLLESGRRGIQSSWVSIAGVAFTAVAGVDRLGLK